MDDLGGVLVLIVGDLVALVAMLWTTSAGASGRLKPNPFAGVRTSATMRDENAWRAGHAAALGPTRILSLVLGLCALAAAVVLALGAVWTAFAIAFAPLVAVLGGAVWIVVVANRAAREAPPA